MADQTLLGSYAYGPVVLSVLIAITASYTALDLAGRVTASRGRARLVWLIGGATSMGIGIWSMHFIGMLAFSLPVPIRYDWPTVLLSLGGRFRFCNRPVCRQQAQDGTAAPFRAASLWVEQSWLCITLPWMRCASRRCATILLCSWLSRFCWRSRVRGWP